jgi:hypothetical protein
VIGSPIGTPIGGTIATSAQAYEMAAAHGVFTLTGQDISLYKGFALQVGTATLYASESAAIRLNGVSFTGSVTGLQYTVNANGVINGGGATIPGTGNSTATGGQKV